MLMGDWQFWLTMTAVAAAAGYLLRQAWLTVAGKPSVGGCVGCRGCHQGAPQPQDDNRSNSGNPLRSVPVGSSVWVALERRPKS